MRVWACCVWICAALVAHAETLVTDAKVIRVDDGFVLQVGTQPLGVADGFETRYWKHRVPAKKDAFKEGDAVSVRIKTDADPPQLREIADKDTAIWLDTIRKGVKRGTVVKVDSKYVTLKFDDGSQFAYRATDKTQVTLKGKSGTGVGALEEGMVVYAKGRLLPNLDTFLVEVLDSAPIVAPKTDTGKAKTPKLPALKADGTLEGQVRKHIPSISMFDIEADRLLHITYSAGTKWTLDGKPASRDALRPLLRVKITYKRDKAGRILASQVEMFSS